MPPSNAGESIEMSDLSGESSVRRVVVTRSCDSSAHDPHHLTGMAPVIPADGVPRKSATTGVLAQIYKNFVLLGVPSIIGTFVDFRWHDAFDPNAPCAFEDPDTFVRLQAKFRIFAGQCKKLNTTLITFDLAVLG